MKKLLIITLAIGLIFCSSATSWGAVHYRNGDRMYWVLGEYTTLIETFITEKSGSASDTWYSINPDKNVIKGDVSSLEDVTLLSGEYILDDQTFVGVSNLSIEGDELTEIRGSYLFDFGLFIGLDYFAYSAPPDTDLSLYIISPGYRLNINEQSYLALSLDYGIDPDTDYSEVLGYDLDYAYYGETAKCYAQYYNWTPEGIDATVYDLGAAFRVADEIVIGFNYFRDEDSSDYDAGLTWKPDFMTLDFMIGTILEDGFYAVSGIVNLTDNIGAGLEVFNIDQTDDNRIMVKFKFENDNSKFIFGYVLDSDLYDAAFNLSYKYSFK